MIKVSIIIPVWNQENLIVKCLDSIPNRHDIEILVINDGSTDNTLEVLNNYTRLKLKIFTIDNQGPGIARNVGIDNAIGKYLLFIDSDDHIDSLIFNLILDTYLDYDYDFIKTKCRMNNGLEYISKFTLRGSFIRKNFVGTIRHPAKYNAEDTKFMRDLEKLRPKIFIYDDNIFYYYNCPRKNSLTWNYRHN